MRRVIVYNRFDTQLFELAEADIFEMKRREVVNGEHSLTITTTRVLEKGWRLLHQDDRGYWHENVVYGTDSLHAAGRRPYGTYYCVWSVQPDLMGTRVSAMPGVQAPVTAAEALISVLSGTSRWVRGTVTNTNTGGSSMYDMDGWSALTVLTENWGGEVDTTIEVGQSGITSRKVDLYSQQGESTAVRRFDFGADLVSVRRTVADGPLYCRITPRGRGEETESGGYGRRITIESVNSGKDYLEYQPMVDLAKLPDGNGGWEYPTLEVEKSNCELPAELKAWAESVIEDYLVPEITYTVDVVQLAAEGIDMQGVSLGDAVHIVDGATGLRISARVMEVDSDEIAGRTDKLVIGGFSESVADKLNSLSSKISTVQSNVDTLGHNLTTADYIDALLDRINAEINATGGYAYIVPGNGILTFDVAVADPLNPVEASQVVEIKGGTIRIANSKTAQGQWEWKTVFTSGHVAAELVTAAQLVTGYIGNANGTYWDLDNNLLHLPATTIMDDTTLGDIRDQEVSAANLVRNGDFSNAMNYWNTGSSSSGDTLVSETDSDYGHHAKFVQSAAGDSTHRFYPNVTTNFTHTVGETYSLSFYAKASASNTIKATVAGSASAANIYINESISSSWKRYTATITPTAAGSLTFWLTNAGTLYLANVMLVHGDKPMDYTPDQRDVAADIETAGTANTMIRAYGSGVLVCKQGNTVGALVNSDGSFDVVKVTWSGTTPTASTVYATFGATVTIGDENSLHQTIDSSGLDIIGQSNKSVFKVGYEAGTTTKAYVTLGTRASGSSVGGYSLTSGYNNTASVGATFAHGNACEASGQYSAAIGDHAVVSSTASAALNYYTIASQPHQTVVGAYNVAGAGPFLVGNGSASARKTVMIVGGNGNVTITGTLTQNSDRRLKTHVAYLGDDANVIIDRLKPAVFIKDGGRHYGFYAQDVQRADIWDTKTVEAQHTDESLDFDPLTLDYTALIAPLTAYVQNLEKRVAELERRLNDAE